MRATLRACCLLLFAMSACDDGKSTVQDSEPPDEPPCVTQVYYPDVDGDGLGDERSPVELCEPTPGYVGQGGDPEPECATNDTDDCGVCAGENLDMDCAGECFGVAAIDGCQVCAGGSSGVEPAVDDWNGDGLPDACDQCAPEGVSRFVVQYDAVLPYAGEGGPYSFQIVLHSNGDVLLQYEDMGTYLASATVGVQGAEGQAVPLGFNDAFAAQHPSALLRYLGAQDGYESLVDTGPPLSWLDVAAVGQRWPMSDDGHVLVELPFDFPIYDRLYSQMRVSANGFLFFGEGDLPGFGNAELPNALGPMVAAFWDDLNPARGGDVYTLALSEGCEQDCDGTWGGVAASDQCGVCSGGATGVEPDLDLDCSGECFGLAALDSCRVCSGGNTGIEPIADGQECPALPDFVIDADYMLSTTSVDYVHIPEDSCAVAEGCVGGTGLRKVLRFGTRIANVGWAHFELGLPPGDGFVWDTCHQHYHYEEYADYQLLDPDTLEELNRGHKNGWCVMDLGVYDASLVTDGCETHDCQNQGINLGCQDTYAADLDCQWIDITGMDDGDYLLNVVTNPTQTIEELNLTNNTAQVRVQIEGDSVVARPAR